MAATLTAALFTTTSVSIPTVVVASESERPKFTLRSTVTFDVNGTPQPLVYTFEVAPNEVNLQRLSLAYGELERPGRKPLLQPQSEQLYQISATFIIAARGIDKYFNSCQAQVDGLVALSQIDTDVSISYPGVPATSTWRITDLSIRTVRRNTMNEVTIAEAEITFTESIPSAAVVPGMLVIKDIPAPRSSPGRPPRSPSTPQPNPPSDSGSTKCQRSSVAGQNSRDADTACRVQTVIDAGRLP